MREFDPDHEIYGAGYRRARRAAIRRSFGICQFCGCSDAEEAHHWGGTKHAGKYPKDYEISPDDLTALCKRCHVIASSLRYIIQDSPTAEESYEANRARNDIQAREHRLRFFNDLGSRESVYAHLFDFERRHDVRVVFEGQDLTSIWVNYDGDMAFDGCTLEDMHAALEDSTISVFSLNRPHNVFVTIFCWGKALSGLDTWNLPKCKVNPSSERCKKEAA